MVMKLDLKLNEFIYIWDDPKYENILKYSRDIEENIPVALTNSSITTYFNQKVKNNIYPRG